MSDIEMKALVFYQKEVAAKFKRADDIVNGDWTNKLIAVQEKIRALWVPGRLTSHRDFEEVSRLWDEEKKLKEMEQEAYRLSVSGEWAGLSVELDEINKSIEYKNWIRPFRNEDKNSRG